MPELFKNNSATFDARIIFEQLLLEIRRIHINDGVLGKRNKFQVKTNTTVSQIDVPRQQLYLNVYMNWYILPIYNSNQRTTVLLSKHTITVLSNIFNVLYCKILNVLIKNN